VAGAAEFAQIRPDGLPLPAAWVVRGADKAQAAGELEDVATPSFDVVIAIQNARVHQAGNTDDLMLKYRAEVYRRLRGWQITPDAKPMKWRGGRVIEYTDGDLYWADSYSFEALVTNYLPDPGIFESLTKTGGSAL
jgi:hypothetical protein